MDLHRDGVALPCGADCCHYPRREIACCAMQGINMHIKRLFMHHLTSHQHAERAAECTKVDMRLSIVHDELIVCTCRYSDWSMYPCHLAHGWVRCKVGTYETIRYEVAVVRGVTELSSVGIPPRCAVSTSLGLDFLSQTVVFPFPDEPSGKKWLILDGVPVISE